MGWVPGLDGWATLAPPHSGSCRLTGAPASSRQRRRQAIQPTAGQRGWCDLHAVSRDAAALRAAAGQTAAAATADW